MSNSLWPGPPPANSNRRRLCWQAHRPTGEPRSRRFAPALPYVFDVCTDVPGPVPTSAGYEMLVDHGLVEAIAGADTVIVAGWDPATGPAGEPLVAALRGAHRRGARIVGFCGATFALAAAGLLDDRRATTHWRLMDELRAAHPRVLADPAVLFVDHGDVATSAGTAAAIDLSLAIVRRDVGARAADIVARHMVMPPRRESEQSQPAHVDPARSHPQDSLAPLTQWVLDHLHEDIRVATLAAGISVSPRSLTRRFREQLGTSPAHWVAQQRIAVARRLLESTDLPVEAIAARTGLGSAGSLRRRLRAATGTTPSAYRSGASSPKSDR